MSGGMFFKFQNEGDCLEGVWQGTQVGKYGDNGIVEVDAIPQLFSMNAALKDLLRVKPGTEVRITYMGKQMSKGGNEFKAYQIMVEDGATRVMFGPFTYVPAMVCAAELIVVDQRRADTTEIQCRVRDMLGQIGGFVYVERARLAALLHLWPQASDGVERAA